MNELNLKTIVKAVVGVIILIVLLIIVFGSWVIISPGEVGGVLRLGSVSRTVGQGINWKIPMIEGVKKNERTDTEGANRSSSRLL